MLQAEAVGEIGKDGRVLILRSVHVNYTLQVSEEQRQVAERVHGMHAEYCPVARSIGGSVKVSTDLRFG